MRVNIYRHEIEEMAEHGSDIISDDQSEEDKVHYGIRFYTGPTPPSEEDANRAEGFTLWVPEDVRGVPKTAKLRKIAREIEDACDDIEEEVS